MALSPLCCIVCIFSALFGQHAVWAYIPASPTNDTGGVAGGPNITDISMLYLRWYMGSTSETVSYQLVGNGSTGISEGALVHFSEAMSWNNETTTTPWIALVACDYNATNASQIDDIFTLARDRGAKSALLYSQYSQACVINPEYADPDNFEQVMDIFSTQSLTSATLIEDQFLSTTVNKTIYGNYNASMLNASAAIINNTMNMGTMNVSSYIFAELKAYNASGSGSLDGGSGSDPSTSSSSGSSSGSGSGGNRNSSLAMIILYAITGCVSALFCLVIITGAIRTIRHPERYGPRNGDFSGRGNGSQTRAQGLTRAILDTFPVVKFGQNTNSDTSRDLDAKDIEMGETPPTLLKEDNTADKDTVEEQRIERSEGGHEVPPASQGEDGREQAQASTSRAVPMRRPSGRARPEEEVVPAVIGRETCPICILDFEEGDDLRILPCEGKHQFHQHCVDPWLLELSSSCPICRQDFHALETMMQGERDESVPAPDFHHNARDSSGGGNRFSRYLRSAIRRRRYREEAAGYDPTDPYMPYAPQTGL